MVEDNAPPKTPPPANMRITVGRGRPLITALWASFIFVAGALAGGAAVINWDFGGPRHRGPRGGSFAEDFPKIMQRDHGLTDEQTSKIREIVRKHAPEFEEIRAQNGAKLEVAFEKMNAEINEVLTPQQQRSHMEKIREGKARHRERSGDGPFGGPPPPMGCVGQSRC